MYDKINNNYELRDIFICFSFFKKSDISYSLTFYMGESLEKVVIFLFLNKRFWFNYCLRQKLIDVLV